MKIVELEKVNQALEKSEKWTIDSIRETLIESINKDIERPVKRLVHYGKGGESYIVLTYANIKVMSAEIEDNEKITAKENVDKELREFRKYLADGKGDKKIKEFMDSDKFKAYKERMNVIGSKNKERIKK